MDFTTFASRMEKLSHRAREGVGVAGASSVQIPDEHPTSCGAAASKCSRQQGGRSVPLLRRWGQQQGAAGVDVVFPFSGVEAHGSGAAGVGGVG